MTDTLQQQLTDALAQIVQASGPAGDAAHSAREIGTALSQKKELKAALQPLAAAIKHGDGIWIVQSCLELPAEHPLHVAACALVANGTVPWPVYRPIAAGGPKRVVRSLRLSELAPTVYAFETSKKGGQMSVWSMETGQHLEDVKIPGKGDEARLLSFAELPDGTLRGITPSGVVLSRKPGGSELKKVLDLGTKGGAFAANADHSRIVTLEKPDIVQQEDGEWLVLTIHHVAEKKKVDVQVPLSAVGSTWHAVGERALIPGMRFIPIGDDDGREDYKVLVLDLATATAAVHPVGGDAWVGDGPDENTVLLSWIERDDSGSHDKSAVLDLSTGALTPMTRKTGDTGYTFQRGRIKHAGELVGGYVVDLESNRTSGVFDPRTGRFALASEVPAAPVRVVERFDPSRPRGQAAVAAPTSLTWARAGALLRYSIADFDAEDEWTFEILEAANDLVLRVTFDEESSPLELRFAASAVASATSFVSFSQGATDAAAGKRIGKQLPPFLLSQAMFAKVASGKKVSWKSPWTDSDTLQSPQRGTTDIDVDGAQQPVSTVSVSGEQVSLRVLDDATWPLILERREGDCHVKLLSLELASATGDDADRPGGPVNR